MSLSSTPRMKIYQHLKLSVAAGTSGLRPWFPHIPLRERSRNFLLQEVGRLGTGGWSPHLAPSPLLQSHLQTS